MTVRSILKNNSLLTNTNDYLRNRYYRKGYCDISYDPLKIKTLDYVTARVVVRFMNIFVDALLENEDGVVLPNNLGTITIGMVNNKLLSSQEIEGYVDGYTPCILWHPYTLVDGEMVPSDECSTLYNIQPNPVLDKRMRILYKDEKLWHLYKYDSLNEIKRTLKPNELYKKASRFSS